MKTTLLLTDFSVNARNAAEFAIGLLGYSSREYLLLNVFVEPFTSSSDAIPIIDVLEKDSKEGLAAEEMYLNSKYADLGLELRTWSEPGGLLFAIDRVIDQFDVDYIVLGSHGSSKVKRPVMGNNAAYVIKNIRVPMLVVPVEYSFSSPGHVLLATDNQSAKDNSSLQPLHELIRQYASKISILNIQQGSSEQVTSTVEHRELKTAFEGIPHHFYREWQKDITMGIVEFVHKNQVDMVCLIERKRSFFDNLFRPSVIKKMSRLTDVPLLILHDRRDSS